MVLSECCCCLCVRAFGGRAGDCKWFEFGEDERVAAVGTGTGAPFGRVWPARAPAGADGPLASAAGGGGGGGEADTGVGSSSSAATASNPLEE